MYTVRTIVHPTDFTALSAQAFEVAFSLAKSTGARLVVFHVAHPPAIVTEEGVLTDPAKGETRDLFAQLKQIHGEDPKVPVEHKVVVADKSAASAQVLEFVKSLSPDLVVMGTHAYSAMRTLMVGSVSEETVRKAPCPVLLVRTLPPEQAEAST